MARRILLFVVAFAACTEDAPDTGAGGSGGIVSQGGSGGAPSDPKAISQSCDAPGQCESGFCPELDGVCCAAACDAPCSSCLELKTGLPNGTCGPIVPGTDPDAECTAPALCGVGQCCGDTPTPPGGPSCPAECTGGCDDDICRIACVGQDACRDATITCPEGYACELQCEGQSACRKTTFQCPETYACGATCVSGALTCRELTIDCDSGPCTLDCSSLGADCNQAEMYCGDEACVALCNPFQSIEQVCGEACLCETGCM